jgi:hypothetical protein
MVEMQVADPVDVVAEMDAMDAMDAMDVMDATAGITVAKAAGTVVVLVVEARADKMVVVRRRQTSCKIRPRRPRQKLEQSDSALRWRTESTKLQVEKQRAGD